MNKIEVQKRVLMQKYIVEKQLDIEDIINYEVKEALEAVKEDGYVLEYVHNQTDEIALAAVKKNGIVRLTLTHTVRLKLARIVRLILARIVSLSVVMCSKLLSLRKTN